MCLPDCEQSRARRGSERSWLTRLSVTHRGPVARRPSPDPPSRPARQGEAKGCADGGQGRVPAIPTPGAWAPEAGPEPGQGQEGLRGLVAGSEGDTGLTLGEDPGEKDQEEKEKHKGKVSHENILFSLRTGYTCRAPRPVGLAARPAGAHISEPTGPSAGRLAGSPRSHARLGQAGRTVARSLARTEEQVTAWARGSQGARASGLPACMRACMHARGWLQTQGLGGHESLGMGLRVG